LRASITGGFAATDNAQYQAQFARQAQVSLQEAVSARRQFQEGITRTKPAVPGDCTALDGHYIAAVDMETRIASDLLEAANQQNIQRVQYLCNTAPRRINLRLGNANQELQKACRQRGLNPPFLFRLCGDGTTGG
jgi:hypothetical protein